MTIKEKILAFLDNQGIKRSEFYNSVGISPSNFKGIAKQAELGGDKIAKILALYPNLSAEWLLRDVGDMLILKDNIQTINDNIKTPQPEYLFEMIKEKDRIIREQAELIGRLKEMVKNSGESFLQPTSQFVETDVGIAH